jgi:CspA family cold shock protein
VISATVRSWNDPEGLGVLDSEETPGGCWVHWSHIDHTGYRRLHEGQTVLLEYEKASQDGYPYCAVRVIVPGQSPARR